MRAAFFGTPAIAVPALSALSELCEVVRVVCQPDKPAGRGLTLAEPAVKVRARELGIPVDQPTKVRTPEFAEGLRTLDLDVAIVMAYGRILPPAVLAAPRLGCINLHASLLPKLRGAAPITWAIVRGDRVSGVSLMQMDEGMDTGPVFSHHEVPIGPNDTAADLAEALAACAADVLRQDLPLLLGGALAATPQEAAGATHAPMLKKEDGRIDWSKSAQEVHDHVRGMSPWPGAWTTLDGKVLKVLATRASPPGKPATPGEVVVADKSRCEIACGEGQLELVKAQLEGRKALAAADLVAGRTLSRGARLGVIPA